MANSSNQVLAPFSVDLMPDQNRIDYDETRTKLHSTRFSNEENKTRNVFLFLSEKKVD